MEHTDRKNRLSITRLLVASDVAAHPLVEEIAARLRLEPEVPAGVPVLDTTDAEQWRQGKKTLYLCRNQGKFLKSCPGTREYHCCGYQVLNVGMNCPYACVYCILQAYLNNPWLSFFVNLDDLCQEVAKNLAGDRGRLHRIGTGEFTDSLVLDHVTALSTRLVPFMAAQANAVLELKTKSVQIANLQGLDHGGKTIVSWSLNTMDVVQREEIYATSIEERLQAAVRCTDWGYALGFHFDPIIYHPGWEKGYAEVIDRLFQTVDPEKIVWISMGALRFLPDLKKIAQNRFPGSRFFFQEEFIDGLDGKKRYFRELRAEMYHFIFQRLKKRAAPSTCIYFCMEGDELWHEVMDILPRKQGGVDAMLDRAVYEHFPFLR